MINIIIVNYLQPVVKIGLYREILCYTVAMMKFDNDKPIEKNQTVELEITALGSDGQGIGRAGGFVIFVPFALPGEHVEALIIKVAAHHAVGKLLRVLRPSPDRVEPCCAVFRRCGGCQLQHMDYAAQLAFKREAVADALRKIGGIPNPAVQPVIGMAEPWRYRNKGIFPVGMGKDGLIMGMYAPRSHAIVDVADCTLQPEPMGLAMDAVRDWAVRHGVSVYDEGTGKGLLRSVMVRHFAETGEAIAVLVTNGPALPHAEELVEELRKAVPGLKGIVQNINTADTNVVLGARHKVLWGSETVLARLGKLSYTVGHHSFFQVNTVQMEHLYDAAAELASLQGGELVVDAYCGVGTIGQFMAHRAAKVIGIESVPQSVEEARRSAARNGIGNAEYICGRAEDVLPQLVGQGLKPDVILMDPPRKGCDSRFLDAVAETGVKKLVYVSCNPATMARDAKYLAGKGYALVTVQPVDMFPQTADVECVGLMLRVDA